MDVGSGAPFRPSMWNTSTFVAPEKIPAVRLSRRLFGAPQPKRSRGAIRMTSRFEVIGHFPWVCAALDWGSGPTALPDQFGNGWNQLRWNDHHGQILGCKGCFVFGDCLGISLLFVMVN